MSFDLPNLYHRLRRVFRLFALKPSEWFYLRQARKSGLFDPVFYRGAHPQIHAIYRRFPLRHYIILGESRGFRPNPDF